MGIKISKIKRKGFALWVGPGAYSQQTGNTISTKRDKMQ